MGYVYGKKNDSEYKISVFTDCLKFLMRHRKFAHIVIPHLNMANFNFKLALFLFMWVWLMGGSQRDDNANLISGNTSLELDIVCLK